MRKSVLITGANGYVGRITLLQLVKAKSNMETIVAQDIRIPEKSEQIAGVTYVQGDIRSPDLADVLAQYAIDTVVHLVSIVTPQKGEGRAFAYSVDVEGTRNLLEACVKHNVQKFIITSSGAAYGYYADNPEWIVETDELRGNPEFAYSDHKRMQEEILAEYRTAHPTLQQLILRPGTIIGETTDNQIMNLFKKKSIIGISGSAIPFVFIWDVDMADIIVKGICEENEGPYNVAGDGALPLKRLSEKLNKPYLNLPPWLLKLALFSANKLGLSEIGPEQLNFLRYRPVLLNTKLKNEFGYIPKFTSEEAFDFFLEKNLKQTTN